MFGRDCNELVGEWLFLFVLGVDYLFVYVEKYGDCGVGLVVVEFKVGFGVDIYVEDFEGVFFEG